MSLNFLSARIDQLLLKQLLAISFIPKHVLLINIDEPTRAQLSHLFSSADINQFPLAVEKIIFPGSPIDLLLADLSTVVPANLPSLLSKAWTALSEQGLLVFVIIENSLLNEQVVIEDLKQFKNLFFSYHREPLSFDDNDHAIDCIIFFASKHPLTNSIVTPNFIPIKNYQSPFEKKNSEPEEKEFESKIEKSESEEKESESEEKESETEEKEPETEEKEPESEEKEPESEEKESESEGEEPESEEKDPEPNEEFESAYTTDDKLAVLAEQIITLQEILSAHSQKLANQLKTSTVIAQQMSKPTLINQTYANLQKQLNNQRDNHQQLLTRYQALHKQHQQLLNRFLDQHEQALDYNNPDNARYRELIHEHQALQLENANIIEKNQNFLTETLHM